jgi:hypothetical protein
MADFPETEGGNRAARVLQTGIALVHEGEIVLPAAGSEAQAEQVMEDSRAVITYYFPVEIEVFLGDRSVDMEEIVDETLRRLAIRMENS